MDGIALVGKVPGLAVDGRRRQAGRFQLGISLVRDLLHGFASEALQVLSVEVIPLLISDTLAASLISPLRLLRSAKALVGIVGGFCQSIAPIGNGYTLPGAGSRSSILSANFGSMRRSGNNWYNTASMLSSVSVFGNGEDHV